MTGRLSAMLMNFSAVSPTLSSRDMSPTLSSVLESRSRMISLMTVLLPLPVPEVNRVISPCLIPLSLALRPARQAGYGTDSTFCLSWNLSQIASPVRIPAGFHVAADQIACIIASGPCSRSTEFGSLEGSVDTLHLPGPTILAAWSTALRPASSSSNMRTTVSKLDIHSLCSSSTEV